MRSRDGLLEELAALEFCEIGSLVFFPHFLSQ